MIQTTLQSILLASSDNLHNARLPMQKIATCQEVCTLSYHK